MVNYESNPDTFHTNGLLPIEMVTVIPFGVPLEINGI